MNSLKLSLNLALTNARGWKTNQKIVVIESDDWGSIRMPSKETYYKLLKKGIRVDQSLYDINDALENNDDLNFLFDLLLNNASTKSQPIFTFNTVMQNPNFEKIRTNNFKKFYGTDLFESYKYYYGEDLEPTWRTAIDQGIMMPQYHAREHLNAYLWLNDLKLGLKDTKNAFDLNFFGLKTKTSSKLRSHYLATYFSETKEEFDFVKLALEDGAKQFNTIFGFNSKTFIASNYIWPKQLESELLKLNFTTIQGQIKQTDTDFSKDKISHLRHYTGQKNKLDQFYSVRNIIFEPYLNQNINWAELALKQIDNAFFWNTPAIISSHRINYASHISVKNRDSSLRHLSGLLQKINTKYPDVIFLSSSQLNELMTLKTKL
jgi:predicted deacetylase